MNQQVVPLPTVLTRAHAYRSGRCVDCQTTRYSAGRPRCEDCHGKFVKAARPDLTPAVNVEARARVADAVRTGDIHLGIAVALIESQLGGVIIDDQPTPSGVIIDDQPTPKGTHQP
jgi:hypothetical protein